MKETPQKVQNIKFLILTVLVIFLSPWLYKFMFIVIGGIIHELSYVVIAITAVLIGVLYTKLNPKLWLLLICLILLPTIAWELKSFVSFEIAYANNEVHIEPSDFMPEGEMYRNFDSYFEFAYGNEYWNGFKRLLKYQLVWLIVPFAYIIIKKTLSKKSVSNDLIDQ